LRFLIKILSIVFIGNKRSIKDISSDNNSDKIPTKDTDSDNDSDENKTPTKNTGSDNDVTPNETLNDISDMKNIRKKLEDVLSGKEINKEDLDEIKEEYSSYFDEDSENTEKEGIEQIKEYLDGEIEKATNSALSAGLSKALEELNVTSDTKSSEEPLVPESKKVKTNETTLSPVDYVIDKQSMEPINPGDMED
jgi:hypothetical protein